MGHTSPMDLTRYSDDDIRKGHDRWHEQEGSPAAHVLLSREAARRGIDVGCDVAKGDAEGTRQQALSEVYEYMAEVLGPWDQSDGPDGCGYTSAEDNVTGRLCADCVFWEGLGVCEIVSGAVDPLGVCRLHISVAPEQPDQQDQPGQSGDAGQPGMSVQGPMSMAKADAKRFTLAPWYVPDSTDAHGEWTDGDELQQALWSYVKSGDRRVRLQHDPGIVAGEWVEAVTWPFEVSLPMTMADGSQQVQTFPPDTVFLGVVWEPWAWSRVVSGEINGYSIGGQADRVVAGD